MCYVFGFWFGLSQFFLDFCVVLGGCWVVHNLWFDFVWVFDLVIVLIVEVVGSLYQLNLLILGWRYAEIS